MTYRKTKRFNGKRYEATGKTEAEAYQRLADKIAAAKLGVETMNGSTPVKKWFDIWFEACRESMDIGEATLKQNRYFYGAYVDPYIGKMRMQDVKDIHLQRILNHLAGMSHSTVSKVRWLLKQLFHKALASHMISWDPSMDLRMPRVVAGTRRALSREEQDAVLDVAGFHEKGLWVKTLLLTGMRPGEAAALRWSNVDLDSGEIHVIAARETGCTRTKEPKTAAGVRDIPIHADLLDELREEKTKADPMGVVFPNVNGTVPGQDTCGKWWRDFRETVEKHHPGVLGEDVTLYCLRHTFATNLAEAGVPMNVTKDLMGHADIQTTANVYTHRSQEAMRQGIHLLEKLSEPSDLTVGKVVGVGG